MKRKYLSALLMGVLTLTSVSTFTSCKDYDDDISNLQEQIDKLATADQLSQKVAELQALISSNKSDITSLQTKVAEALTAAQKAQTTADSKATLDEVKAELEKYATKDEVATVKATLEAAQKALEEKNDAALKDAVQKAQEAADKAVADAKAAVEEVKTDLASYKTTVASEQEVVNTALATLNTKVDAKADTTALNKAIAALTAADANAKAEILSEIASKYATKKQADEIDAALKKFAIKIEQQLGDYAKTAEVQRLLAELKKNADVTYATKEEIKNLQTKQAVEEAINKAIGELPKGDLEAINKIAREALEKANTAESEKGLAYLQALHAEGAASDAAKAAKLADDKAVNNQTDIKNIQDALGAGFDAKNTVAKAIQLINDQLTAKNTGLSGLDGRLKSIESKLALEDPDKSLVERVSKIEDQLKEIIGEYTTMVTEVSLLGSFSSGTGLTNPGATTLQFISGKVAQDLTFGKAEKDDEGAVVPSATNQQAFVKGTLFNNKNEILVRVNPTNAVLTKASIKLVDSQGNDLDDILEIGEPKKYEKLLVSQSRATDNTGLWTIPVTVKDGVAKDKVGQLSNGKKILYAVAVNNTNSEAAKDRYVASTYDITVPNAKDFEAATNINKVKIWSVNTMGYDNALTLGLVSDETPVKEYAGGSGTPVSAKNGETIKISFKGLQDKIKYFYVVRDDSHVDDKSGSSAINAWKSYKYEGNAYGNVVEVNPSDPTGELKITINGKVGDEIGFRLFAVNYDGTLTPVPANGVGGMGFVVNVGADQAKASVTGNVLATDPSSCSTGWLPLTGKLKDGVKLYVNSSATPVVTNVFTADNGVKFEVEYSTDGKNAITGTSTENSAIKYVKFTTVSSTHMNEWVDDSKANFTIVQKDKDGLVENEIAVSLTKKLPTAADVKKVHPYTWKDEQVENGVFTAYVSPTSWASTATVGSFRLDQVITGLNDNFKITFENAKENSDSHKYTDPLVITSDTINWKVTVNKAVIDGKEHKTTISYNYGQVTSAKNKNGQYIDLVVPVETVQTVFACPLNKKDQTYAWNPGISTQATADADAVMVDINYLTYGSTTTAKVYKDKDATAPTEVDLLDYIIGTNTYDNAEFGGSLTKLLSGETKKYVKLEDAKLISAQSGKEDYFNASVNATTGKIEFRAVADVQNPRNDVKSWLVITLKDAFGCDQTYKLPFTVKKRQ